MRDPVGRDGRGAHRRVGARERGTAWAGGGSSRTAPSAGGASQGDRGVEARAPGAPTSSIVASGRQSASYWTWTRAPERGQGEQSARSREDPRDGGAPLPCSL